MVNNLTSNISFADRARSAIKPPTREKVNQGQIVENIQPSSGTNMNDFLNESKNLFNISFKELLFKIRQFWPNYQKLQSKEDKMFAYLDFVASIVT